MLPAVPPAIVQIASAHHHHHGRHFIVIEGTVLRLLPEDTRGVPHQRFLLQVTRGQAPAVLEVDNDERYGARVPHLVVGEPLTIRGVRYHDRRKDGIHWTHHRDRAGDAGYIQTPDGRIYQ